MLTHKGTGTIETARLILRRAVIEDAEHMYSNWACDAEVTKFLTWPPHGSVEVSRERLRSWLEGYERPDYYQWMIVPKALGEPIGSISVIEHDDLAEKAEIGYCIGKAWWHRGYMSEALKAVMDYLFDQVGMNRIEAKHDLNNPNSGHVMKKCGMRFEGVSIRSGHNNSGICDLASYALLKSQRHTPHFMYDYAPENDEALVQELYSRFDEDKRLKSKAGRVEFFTTVRAIEAYLRPGAKILDIGAGAGEYSLYFAQKGYEVTALELSEKNLAAFRQKLTEGSGIELSQGNAMDLSRYEDGSFDIVLLLGPLYHLHSESDRLRCIREAKRVCRPGGKIFFAFISNDIVILCMQQGHPDYLLHGDYDKQSFTCDDYPFVFHRVEDCRRLLAEGGISIEREIATDGLSELMGNMINAMDEKTYAQYLRYHYYLSEKPECLGMSNHLLFIGE